MREQEHFFSCVLGGRKEQKENVERTKGVERICVFNFLFNFLSSLLQYIYYLGVGNQR